MQVQQMDIACVPSLGSSDTLRSDYALVVDAIFGFSFTPPIRQPYDDVITRLAQCQLPIASIDIPSGVSSYEMCAHLLVTTSASHEYASCSGNGMSVLHVAGWHVVNGPTESSNDNVPTLHVSHIYMQPICLCAIVVVLYAYV